jgi:hypothetical protein
MTVGIVIPVPHLIAIVIAVVMAITILVIITVMSAVAVVPSGSNSREQKQHGTHKKPAF